jgi:hypothetical protein
VGRFGMFRGCSLYLEIVIVVIVLLLVVRYDMA